MKGRRIYADEQVKLWLAPGDFGRDPRDGVWYARPPHGMGGPLTEAPSMGSLEHHEVVEHQDRTISVSPYILIEEPPMPPWHGYLERGVWRLA